MEKLNMSELNESTVNAKFELVLQKMDNLNEKYAKHSEQDHENFGQIRTSLSKLVDKVDTLLLDSDKGLVLKVDRLAEAEKKRSWLVKTALGAGFSSVLAHIWSFLKG